MRVAVFPLSANPFHNMHLHIVEWLSAHYDSVYIAVMNNPAKIGQPDYIDLSVRQHMVNLAVDVDIVVCSWEEIGVGARTIRLKYPEAEMWVVLGYDVMKTLPLWTRTEGLDEVTGFVEISRDNISTGMLSVEVNSTLLPVEVMEMNTPLIIAPMISSTLIRRAFREQNMAYLMKTLPSPVLDYLLTNNIYA